MWKIWKEKYENLKEIDEKKIKKLEKQLKDSQSSKEPLAGEIIDCNSGIESKKSEIIDLENEIIAKEEEFKKSPENNSLLKELEELRAQLKEKESELAELKRINEELEKKLRENYQKLKDKITEKKQELEKLRDSVAEPTRSLPGAFSPEPGEIEGLVNALCSMQAEIARSELQLENIEVIQKTVNTIKAETKLPSGLAETKLKLQEDDRKTKSKYDYDEIHPKGFLNKFDDRKPTKLPTKLVDLRKIRGDDNLEKLKADKVNSGTEENYAILSYSWGAPPWDRFRSDSESSDLYGGSKKSFRKAIGACKKLSVNYLWIDCLCINQKDEKELAQELRKIRQYYNNAKVTLIPIQIKLDKKSVSLDSLYAESSGRVNVKKMFDTASKIIKRITKSKWFLRMWTFQEGLLSPQTVFMFDDYLIDGRFLAMVWSIEQGPEINLPQLTKKKDDLHDFFEKYSKRVATPLGWAYYEHGYSSEKEVYLGLCQVLEAIEKREGFMLADCVYSALGLLPYGNKIETNYKEEPAEILTKVMKLAVENGYGEPLAWYGEGNKERLGLCWAPKIEKTGETNIKTSIKRVEESIECEPDSVNFTKNGIEINSTRHNIMDAKAIVGSGNVCSRKLLIEDNSDNKWVNLQGERETLEKVMIEANGKSDIMLLVPSRRQWKSSPPIALLARSHNGEIYDRIDLVRILEGSRNLAKPEVKLTIGGMSKMHDLTDLIGSKSNVLENQTVITEAHVEMKPLTYKKW